MGAEKPKVSIVVPMYNVSDYAETCLASLLRQTYTNIEIIVVDDGSTDDTLLICEHFSANDKRLRIFHKMNGGLSSARNYGLSKATGEYLTFVDGDDVLDANAIQHFIDLALSSGVSLVCCQYEKVNNANDFSSSNEGVSQLVTGKRLLKMLLTLDGESGSACCKLYSKDLFPLLVFPEGQLFEDFGVMARLFSSIENACVSSAKVYGYLTREGSITTAGSYNERHIEGMGLSLRSVKEILDDDLTLQEAYSCFEAFCFLRIASRLDVNACVDKRRAKNYIAHARACCRSAVFSHSAKVIWRVRCLLFAVSPKLHTLFYRMYGHFTGKVMR